MNNNEALTRIASASPCLSNPATPQERGCKLCEALINEARDALGFQRWPAVPATPVDEQFSERPELEAIRKWSPPKPWTTSREWAPIMELCMEAWDHEMGVLTVDANGRTFTFSTGGWPANEAVIEALHANLMARSILWESSHRGGKYVYALRDNPTNRSES